jgi:N-acetyl-gamma-glutamyl-phosphate reductase
VISVGIIGASGYAGAELLRLCAMHPEFQVEVATGDSQAGTPIGALYPSLAAAYRNVGFETFDAAKVDGLDLVFFALPHGASQQLVPDVRPKVKHVVDLGADFRLKDATLYPQWYGDEHAAPELLADFAYGLPEIYREAIQGATAVAAPGCYPTASILALSPLVEAGLIERDGIIVDAASGVSGAGRDKFPFCGTDEDLVAYGLLDHRHTPEIEQAVGGTVLFTPHLVPMNRGILATCYARPTASASAHAVMDALHDAYDDEPFVVVTDDPPHTKATAGANTAHVTARYDSRTGHVVSLCAIDNLVKGAAGQAVQCANLLAGLEETVGLPDVAVYP